MPLLREPFTFERFTRVEPTLRPLGPADVPFLTQLVYEAASVEPTVRALGPGHALALPVLARYVRRWGRPGDDGLLAVASGGTALGAAWHRLFAPAERGNGVVAWPGVPEVIVLVRRAERGRGVGAALLQQLLHRARSRGHARLVAAVEWGSPAVRFHRRHGFTPVEVADRHAGGQALLVAELP